MKSALVAVLARVALTAGVTNAQQQCADLTHFECPPECFPTCGSDGRTYKTPCHLWFAQCTNRTLTPAGRGVCPGEVHWDAKSCDYETGRDPEPSQGGPIERDVTDSSDDKTAAPSTPSTEGTPRRIDPTADAASRASDVGTETTTTPSATPTVATANTPESAVPAPTDSASDAASGLAVATVAASASIAN